MSVRKIGKDYYAIDAEGVRISDAVHKKFEKALKRVSQIPSGRLKVRLARQKKKKYAVPHILESVTVGE